jgi:hypothetical protein
VEELTGIWINPHQHEEPYYTGLEEAVETDPRGLENVEPLTRGDTPASVEEEEED